MVPPNGSVWLWLSKVQNGTEHKIRDTNRTRMFQVAGWCCDVICHGCFVFLYLREVTTGARDTLIRRQNPVLKKGGVTKRNGPDLPLPKKVRKDKPLQRP